VPDSCLLVVTAAYSPDLPDREVEAAVAADAMKYGARSGYAGEAAHLLRTQLACQQSSEMLLHMLIDAFDGCRPLYMGRPAFLDAACRLKVSRLV
jgi:hypothetical protein